METMDRNDGGLLAALGGIFGAHGGHRSELRRKCAEAKHWRDELANSKPAPPSAAKQSAPPRKPTSGELAAKMTADERRTILDSVAQTNNQRDEAAADPAEEQAAQAVVARNLGSPGLARMQAGLAAHNAKQREAKAGRLKLITAGVDRFCQQWYDWRNR